MKIKTKYQIILNFFSLFYGLYLFLTADTMYISIPAFIITVCSAILLYKIQIEKDTNE